MGLDTFKSTLKALSVTKKTGMSGTARGGGIGTQQISGKREPNRSTYLRNDSPKDGHRTSKKINQKRLKQNLKPLFFEEDEDAIASMQMMQTKKGRGSPPPPPPMLTQERPKEDLWLTSRAMSSLLSTYSPHLRLLMDSYSTVYTSMLSLSFEQLCHLCVDFQLFQYCDEITDRVGGRSTVTTFNSTTLSVLRTIYRKEAMRTIITPTTTPGTTPKTSSNRNTNNIQIPAEHVGRPRVWNITTLGRVLARIAIHNARKTKSVEESEEPEEPKTACVDVKMFFDNVLQMKSTVAQYRLFVRENNQRTFRTLPTGTWPTSNPHVLRGSDVRGNQNVRNLDRKSTGTLLFKSKRKQERLRKTKGWRVALMERPRTTDSENVGNSTDGSRASTADYSMSTNTLFKDSTKRKTTKSPAHFLWDDSDNDSMENSRDHHMSELNGEEHFREQLRNMKEEEDDELFQSLANFEMDNDLIIINDGNTSDITGSSTSGSALWGDPADCVNNRGENDVKHVDLLIDTISWSTSDDDDDNNNDIEKNNKMFEKSNGSENGGMKDDVEKDPWNWDDTIDGKEVTAMNYGEDPSAFYSVPLEADFGLDDEGNNATDFYGNVVAVKSTEEVNEEKRRVVEAREKEKEEREEKQQKKGGGSRKGNRQREERRMRSKNSNAPGRRRQPKRPVAKQNVNRDLGTSSPIMRARNHK